MSGCVWSFIIRSVQTWHIAYYGVFYVCAYTWMFLFKLHTPKIIKQIRKVKVVAHPNIRSSAWFCMFYVVQLTEISDTLQKYSMFTFWIRALLHMVSCNTFLYVASSSNISFILHEKKTWVDSHLLFYN